MNTPRKQWQKGMAVYLIPPTQGTFESFTETINVLLSWLSCKVSNAYYKEGWQKGKTLYHLAPNEGTFEMLSNKVDAS